MEIGMLWEKRVSLFLRRLEKFEDRGYYGNKKNRL